MRKRTPQIVRHIYDNLWTVLSYAFAQPVVNAVIDKRLIGQWKYLRQTVNENAELRAGRALLEMATLLRVLDDADRLSDLLAQDEQRPLGRVVQADGTTTDLHFRDMTNKLIHGDSYEWQLGGDDPRIIVHSNEPKRWRSAEIGVVRLMGLIGKWGY
jgi:hypothetical protein